MLKERSQRWNPELRPKDEAPQSSVVEGVDGAAPAGVADECDGLLGRELLAEDEKQHAE